MLKNNVGGIDRAARIFVGLSLLATFFMLPDVGYRWFFLIGIVPLATAILGSCPLYTIFGLSTCKMKS